MSDLSPWQSEIDQLNDDYESPEEILLGQALSIPMPIAAIFGDEVLLKNVVDDLARKMVRPEIIAKRYSLDPIELIELIRDNAEFRKKIQITRAIWESSESLDTRIRQYAGITLLDGIRVTGKKLVDSTTPPNLQLDYLKAYSRMAGVDGPVPIPKGNENFGGGNQFVVNFHFSGGRVERISTMTDPNPGLGPVIEHNLPEDE